MEEEVNGEEVTQIMLVVGAENQNFEANMQLARDLKGSPIKISRPD